MPHISARDGIRLYYEEAGSGSAAIFVHEYAGDCTWEPQMRHFSRAHRCVTYSQRGSPPSDVPEDGARYSQDIARDDVIALLDALKIDKAHVVGHSMGAYTALHVGMLRPERCLSVTVAGCDWGSTPDAKKREEMKALAAETRRMFAAEGIIAAAAKYADAPMHQALKYKNPRGYAEFSRMLAEHSAQGHAHTMLNLQLKRPTLWEMEDHLKHFAVPLLVVVGDEDEPCIDGSVFLKRAAFADLFAAAQVGRWWHINQSRKSSGEDYHGPQAQRQDRADHRRQRRHRQGHRPRAGPGGRRSRDLRAAQGAARDRRE